MRNVEPFVSDRMYILGISFGIQVTEKIERSTRRSTRMVVTKRSGEKRR